jgi:hypothetical protein
MSSHISRATKEPLADLIELSKETAIGFSAEELKKKAVQERLTHYFESCLVGHIGDSF